MKNITGTFLLALFTLSSFGLAYYQLTERTIEPDYSLKFSTRSTDGTFSGLDGTVIFSPSDVENAKIDVKLDAATIETGGNRKNEHVNSADWLDTKKYPEIRFTSSKFQKQGDTFIVDGTESLKLFRFHSNIQKQTGNSLAPSQLIVLITGLLVWV
jgi:hypothetical protein